MVSSECTAPKSFLDNTPAAPPDDGVTIRVSHLTKSYRIWNDPSARLKAPFVDSLARLIPPGLAARSRLQERAHGYYRDFNALTDCSFEVRRGETFGIVGQNGAGKSTSCSSSPAP
jgi:ABC-type polysaccharide/polyol phosphate transport system ATPase subunit